MVNRLRSAFEEWSGCGRDVWVWKSQRARRQGSRGVTRRRRRSSWVVVALVFPVALYSGGRGDVLARMSGE